MFYLLKHLLLLNLIIFKLKCNNLIFNEIMILNASYVCLLRSRFIENHLEDGPLISEVVLSYSPVKPHSQKSSASGSRSRKSVGVKKVLASGESGAPSAPCEPR
jgi:hypothetical protein